MVSIVAFTLGVAWMFCLPVVSVVTGELKVRGTYFDETTLSPMAARATLHTSEGFRAYLRSVNGSFCDELIALDIACQERYNASWGVVRPASGWAAVEAFAVVASNKRAIPIVLALARFLREAPWLGKNVVVVASDDPQRWVGAYHNGDDEDLLFERGGLLGGAVLINLPEAEPYGAVSIKAHGFDGELPNLDFFHLAATAFPQLVHGERL